MLYSFLLGTLLGSSVFAQQSSTTPSPTGDTDSATTSSSSKSSPVHPSKLSDLCYTILSGTLETSFTGTYATDTSVITVFPSSRYDRSSSSASSSNGTRTSTTTVSPGTTSELVLLVGGAGKQTLSVINGTSTVYPNDTAVATSPTSIASAPTNTQACNNYPEFCDRKYSNITEVCAHNAMFVKPGNAASNQALDITTQLDDGVRMIQGETHYENDTMWSCHTSCDLLNMGTLEEELVIIREWVEKHPYDVVTVLIANNDFVTVGNFTAPFQKSGLALYLYEPPTIPLHKNDWPTLSQMLLSGKRVVVFMDYNANQTAVPYILDQYSHIWETQFSPEDESFPCTIQRPPTLTNATIAKENYMYLANHNLNQAITLLGNTLLVPNTVELNNTNAAGNQHGMLGATVGNCTEMWNAPPNWLVVDYYNVGNGSVFEVAARCNNVTYNRKCCGIAATSIAPGLPKQNLIATLLVAVATFVVATI